MVEVDLEGVIVFEPPRRQVRQGRQIGESQDLANDNGMDINGFDLKQPDDVCDSNGLDENHARAHFNAVHRDEVKYSDERLLEDLMWMSHEAFKYYLPGFLKESLNDDYGDIASGTLSAIQSHLSGPRAHRIRFSQEQCQTLDTWFDLILRQFGEDDTWGFVPRIAKYRERIWLVDS